MNDIKPQEEPQPKLPYLKQLGGVINRKVDQYPIVAAIILILFLIVIYNHWEVAIYVFLAVATSVTVGLLATHYYNAVSDHGLTEYEQAIFAGIVSGTIGFIVGTSAHSAVDYAKKVSDGFGNAANFIGLRFNA